MSQVPSRIGAIGAIAGALTLLGGTMLHPMSADPGDPLAAFTEYAADARWLESHLGQFIGVALMVIGLIAARDTLEDERIQWLARLGAAFAVAALATAAALQAVDGVALKRAIDHWARAPADQRPGAFLAAFAIRQIEIGLASFTAMLFGATATLYGAAMAASRGFPRWLGAIGGAGTIIGGVLTAKTGFSATAMTVSMPFSLLTVLWMILVGAILWRPPRRPP
jgi:hypothetical protein